MNANVLFSNLTFAGMKDCDALILAASAKQLDLFCDGKTLDGKPAGFALMERYVGDGDPRMLLPQEASAAMRNIIEGKSCVAALTAEDLYALSDEGFFSVVDGTWAMMFDETRKILTDIQDKMFADEDAGEFKAAS